MIRSDNRGSESLFPVYTRVADAAGSETWQANFAPRFIDEFVAATAQRWLPLGSGDLIQTFGPDNLAAYIYALFHSTQYRERHADQLRRDFPRVLTPQMGGLFVSLCRYGKLLIGQHLLRDVAAEQTRAANDAAHDVPIDSFRVGGYAVLRKWLQPKQRSPADAAYRQIAAAIGQTLEIQARIDRTVAEFG